MTTGIYSITFRGAADWGMGVLVLQHGKVTGADIGGVLYDGSYSDHGDHIHVDMNLTVPPGVQLVQGTQAKSSAYSVPFKTDVPIKAIENNSPVLLNLPPGPINVIFKLLRQL